MAKRYYREQSPTFDGKYQELYTALYVAGLAYLLGRPTPKLPTLTIVPALEKFLDGCFPRWLLSPNLARLKVLNNKSLSMIMGIWANENNRGKNMIWHNIGAVKADPKLSDHCYYTTNEHVPEAKGEEDVNAAKARAAKGDNSQPAEYGPDKYNQVSPGWVRVTYKPDHPTACFLAFPTLADGCRDYWERLGGRFKPAWSALESGDAQAFATALYKMKYYTGFSVNGKPPDEVYAGIMRSFQWEFRTLQPPSLLDYLSVKLEF